MKIIIFEGIATSGKSTVIARLKDALSSLNIGVASESETHEPIMEERSDKHIKFFQDLINRKVSDNLDVLIFDRLYLTQAFRTKSGVNDYSVIEHILSQYSPLTVFLTVDEDSIEDRVSKAAEHRAPGYFKSHGTPKERARYYIDQQRHQLELLKTSTIPYKIFDTTDHDYERVVQEILESLKV